MEGEWEQDAVVMVMKANIVRQAAIVAYCYRDAAA